MKYILLLGLLILFVLNFTIGKLMKLITKKEIAETTEMKAKGVIYVLVLALVIVIMVYF